MAAQKIRIEIVPFPDPEESAAPEPGSPRSGLTPLTADPGAEPGIEESPADESVAEESVAEEVTEESVPEESVPEESVPEESVPEEVTEPIGAVATRDADELDDEPTAHFDVDADADVDPDVEAEADAEPEPEPEPDADADAESGVDAHGAADADLDGAIDAEHDPDAGDPDDTDRSDDFIPTPGARAARRRAAQAVPPASTSAAEEHVDAPLDESSLRATTISGRLLFLTLGSVTLAALVVLASIWGLARISSAGRDIAGVSAAKEASAAVLAELRLVEAADAEGPDVTRRLDSLAADAADEARPWISAFAVGQAGAATDAYVAARGDGPAAAEYDDAFAAQRRVDDQLRDRQLDEIDRSESLRTTAIVVVMLLFALGSIALVVLGRIIGRSVVAPLRSLGRTLRRFGDGDLRSRSEIAPDEVGTLARSFNVMADSVSARVRRLTAIAERDAQLRMVSDALDLADRETDVYRILEQALAILTPDNPGELLVNEPTSPRLWQVSTNPSSGPGGCPVETAEACPAMRRAQAVVFDGPSAINACPQLRLHESPCSAACVPVGVNGHLLGVVHVTAPEHEPPDPEVVEQLVTLAGQVGVRVGAQRTLETTRLQASTDGLTGLANRRMLEARLNDLLRGQVSFALAVADVDLFKTLNDNYGHETGDRALQLFAKVLEDNVRGHDVVARYGGEEFVLVYPELTVKKAMEVIERIRLALEKAIEAAGLPPFTCSFGVTHSSSADTVDGIIRIADAGLLQAKDLGRNRVVFADLDLAAEVFGSGGASAVIDLTEAVDADDVATDGAEAGLTG
ncbi:MAG TPA: diguanylate cyclase [Microthrixaceae bacterium]|nr:diguanylate cyclase [Microthrixaceae bacterium]